MERENDDEPPGPESLLDFFSILPADLLQLIMEDLKIRKDNYSVSLSCKRLHGISRSNRFWQGFCNERWTLRKLDTNTRASENDE
jgi:hypothetical protein